ncbi:MULTISPECIES: thioesterase II family protein [Actinomadura]|uniref:Surfactin synthase thioesterase subunit n=1 Tax=Actinomadura madurae TaxID=1993 RepID=A0A1I5AEV5_9ACTN|nr:alpha/beta fold hydrolase [Actinomadura madurae]SFN61016.1 Surfactin synthase thioesterase subunit [Actinomadura madurae]SPT57041.1 Linear gramicidin dehydrogenase LgrE [Actinomadura madurae]
MTWFRCPETRPWASLRLFCLPHAGGSAVFYRTWAKEVSPAVEMHTVQYPGRADRMADALVTDAHQLARLIAGAMAPLMDRPAALFGHSMGAVLAYEVARLLQERGSAPAHVFASGARPPHDRGDDRVADQDDDGVVAEMIKLGGTDADALRDPELRELVLPYVRNDFALIEDYAHKDGTRLAVPVTAIIGDSDPHVTPGQARGWEQVTDGRFALKVLPGGHFYLAEQRPAVIGEIHRALEVPALG